MPATGAVSSQLPASFVLFVPFGVHDQHHQGFPIGMADRVRCQPPELSVVRCSDRPQLAIPQLSEMVGSAYRDAVHSAFCSNRRIQLSRIPVNDR